ncbi:MAG: hypothetical protein FWG11_02375 [Promicromonosporaceae bacterium]|nr:hypothetical protein [Promicromonosporaceae bacterium]
MFKTTKTQAIVTAAAAIVAGATIFTLTTQGEAQAVVVAPAAQVISAVADTDVTATTETVSVETVSVETASVETTSVEATSVEANDDTLNTTVSDDASQAPVDEATSIRDAAEAEAALHNVTIHWGDTQGQAGAFSPAEPGVIRVNPAIIDFGLDTTIAVVRHEAAHNEIQAICGTATPEIAGSAFEAVTDAYADTFFGGLSYQNYGFTADQAAIAAAINAGSCN